MVKPAVLQSGPCPLCLQRCLLTKHHICPRKYAHTQTYKKVVEDSGNYLYVCRECHDDIHKIEPLPQSDCQEVMVGSILVLIIPSK
jgi:hypothetical protein